MSAQLSNPEQSNDTQPSLGILNVAAFGLAVIVGTIAAVAFVPSWLPVLFQSLMGVEPKAYWDVSRASAVIAYLLLWASVMWGLLITNKMSQRIGAVAVVDLHEFLSLLGLVFAALHAIVLLGDRYTNFTVLQLLIPFATWNYNPPWTGVGQIAFYLLIPITFSFYIRKWIGHGAWRWLHFGTFLFYSFITVHAMLAGTDTKTMPMLAMYALTGASVFFMTFYRLFTMAVGANPVGHS